MERYQKGQRFFFSPPPPRPFLSPVFSRQNTVRVNPRPPSSLIYARNLAEIVLEKLSYKANQNISTSGDRRAKMLDSARVPVKLIKSTMVKRTRRR